MPITPESHSCFVATLILTCFIGLRREELIRTVISRAYYSAFIKARDFAGMTHVVYGVHTKVRKYYSRSAQTEAESSLRDGIKKRLDALFKLRVKADYNFGAKLGYNKAMKCVELMEETLQLIDQLEALPQG